MFMKKVWNVLKVVLYILIFPFLVFFAIIKGFTEDNLKESKRYRNSDDKLFGLTKYEKEEVRKGRYKPSQFSEKDEGDYLDSDDYYYDE